CSSEFDNQSANSMIRMTPTTVAAPSNTKLAFVSIASPSPHVCGAACSAPARSRKILLHPPFGVGGDCRNRSQRRKLTVVQHGNTIADSVQRIEIVGNEEHGKP